MNHLTRYEPLVGRLDNLFNEFFRPAYVWENAAASEPHGRWRITTARSTNCACSPTSSRDRTSAPQRRCASRRRRPGQENSVGATRCGKTTAVAHRHPGERQFPAADHFSL